MRRRLASLYLEAGQFDDALQHLKYLQDALPEDAEVAEMVGRCHEGRGQYSLAAADYRSALKHEPGRVDSALRLARLLRDRLSRAPEAERFLADLVQADPKSYQARLARAQFLQEGTPSEDALKAARADMDEALRLAPNKADVLLAAAHEAERRPDGREEARSHLRKLLEADPQDNRGYEALAELELHAGRSDEAMKALRLGLERRPDDPNLLWNLANLVTQLGTPEEGERLTARLDADGLSHAAAGLPECGPKAAARRLVGGAPRPGGRSSAPGRQLETHGAMRPSPGAVRRGLGRPGRASDRVPEGGLARPVPGGRPHDAGGGAL